MIAAVSLLTPQFIWGMACRHGRVHLSIIVSSHGELLGGACHDTNRHIPGNNRTIQIVTLPAVVLTLRQCTHVVKPAMSMDETPLLFTNVYFKELFIPLAKFAGSDQPFGGHTNVRRGPFSHTRSHDFLCSGGAHFFPKKFTTF